MLRCAHRSVSSCSPLGRCCALDLSPWEQLAAAPLPDRWGEVGLLADRDIMSPLPPHAWMSIFKEPIFLAVISAVTGLKSVSVTVMPYVYPHALFSFSCDFFGDFPSLVNTNLHRCYYFPLDSIFKPLSVIQIYSGLLDSFSGGQGAASKPPFPPPLILHLCKDSCSWKEVITTQKTPSLPPAAGWWQRTR